jgi:peptidoglycan/LPS O-acetylase OafA/YrhL
MTCGSLSSRCWINRLPLERGARILATGAYAFYLVHKPFMHLAQAWVDPNGALALPLALLLGGAGAWALYFFVERPFLQLRARIGAGARVGARQPLLHSAPL